MAEPRDSATFLEDVSAIVQQKYMPEFTEEYSSRFGRTTNKLFRLDEMEITGDGRTMQVELAPGDTVRASADVLGAFAAPDRFEPGTLKARFNKQTTSANDFIQISASAQVDDIDIEEAGKGSIVDFCDRIYKQVMPNYEEHLAQLRQSSRNAVQAWCNGTPTLNNSWYIGGATSTATNTGGLRVAVDNGSIANFRRGARLDFINPATGTVRAGNVRVTDVNEADLTIGVAFTSDQSFAPWVSTGDLATVADNDYIVRSGEYNAGLYSMGAWFSRPVAGESFLGGVDRTTAAFRWLNTRATREGSAAIQVNKSMFNAAAIMLGFLSEDDDTGPVIMTDPTIHQTLRDQIGEDAFIQLPVDDDRMKRFANFGSVGLNYQHGVFGVVKIAADPLCPPNVVRIIASNTWKALYYGWRGLRPVPSGKGGHWYRMNEAAPNTGLGKMWKADWYAIQTDFCTQPWKNGQILNVTA